MVMELADHYRSLLGRPLKVFEDSLLDLEAKQQLTRSYNFSSDFELLIYPVRDRPEGRMFDLAIREYQFSLYAAAGGSYRHAHISLRLFTELFLAGIFFSAYEIKLRAWLTGAADSDIIWSAITHADTGVLSPAFLRTFHPGIETRAKQYQTIASAVYRECSEFVHGNMHTHQAEDPGIAFSRDSLIAYVERTEAVRLCIMFAFCGRYLTLLPLDEREPLREVVIEVLGHIKSVRHAFFSE